MSLLPTHQEIMEGLKAENERLRAELAEARERPKKHTAYWYHHQGWEAAIRRCVEVLQDLQKGLPEYSQTVAVLDEAIERIKGEE